MVVKDLFNMNIVLKIRKHPPKTLWSTALKTSVLFLARDILSDNLDGSSRDRSIISNYLRFHSGTNDAYIKYLIWAQIKGRRHWTFQFHSKAPDQRLEAISTDTTNMGSQFHYECVQTASWMSTKALLFMLFKDRP